VMSRPGQTTALPRVPWWSNPELDKILYTCPCCQDERVGIPKAGERCAVCGFKETAS
jgi:hypothetical protein